MGFNKAITNEILDHLYNKGYLEYPVSGIIEITVSGMDYIENLIPNSNEVRQVLSNRIKMLKELYKHGTQGWRIDMWKLGNDLGFPDEDSLLDLTSYLQIKGLVSFHYSLIKITSEGIDFVESYLS